MASSAPSSHGTAAHAVVIKGGTIVDGTGRAAFAGDVAIDAGRITAVGGRLQGERTIAADDAAEIVRSLRAFCADPPQAGVRSLHALRDVLDPERFATRVRKLAAGYARLAAAHEGPRAA